MSHKAGNFQTFRSRARITLALVCMTFQRIRTFIFFKNVCRGGSSDEGDRLLLHSLPAVFGAQRGVCGAGRPLERRLPWRLLLGRQDHAVQLASRAHGGRPGGAVRKRRCGVSCPIDLDSGQTAMEDSPCLPPPPRADLHHRGLVCRVRLPQHQ